MTRFLAAAVILTLAGCDLSMRNQPRSDAAASVTLWPHGPARAGPPEGAIAFEAPSEHRRPPVTQELIARGRERYAIYCTPCHAASGDGRGPVVARGFPRPPDLASARVRAAGADELYNAISDGYGVMYGFADRVPERDRWAVVLYVRALQRARPDNEP